jgi:hypothetical protein
MTKDMTLSVAKLAALFASLAAAVYTAIQAEPSPLIVLFLSWGPFAVVLWLQKDAQRTGTGPFRIGAIFCCSPGPL